MGDDRDGLDKEMAYARSAASGVAMLLAAVVCGGPSAVAQARPPGYVEAASAFQSAFNVEQRLFFQVLMTAAGYWNAVPNENFNQRLFKAVQRFQTENGLTPNGAVDKAQLERLFAVATPMLDLWSFRKVSHPSRRTAIWIPFGLGLHAVRNEFGLTYVDPQKRAKIEFTTVPNVGIGQNYAAVLNTIVREGAKVHYRVMKDGWFVISATTPDGIDHYMRYHQDGAYVTGFTLSWNNANGNVAGERIAILMSASLWSSMTGAAFIDPPTPEPKVAVARPAPVQLPPAPQPSAASPTPSKPKATGDSSGTGFFVGNDGSLLTNAHVVDECTTIRVTLDGREPLPARLAASDKANDLALLRVDHRPTNLAAIRIGIRLGEPVAVFGFPLSNVLASTGNFTLGNVTALAGLGDDTRHIQISAPVQPGNSGGPLLDHQGNLVGVVTYKLNALKTVAASGDIPQNVNFALKSSAAASFLESNRVAFETGTATATLGPADLADYAKAVSVFITCTK
jgi:serine protease Do